MYNSKRVIAIIGAAGSGKRMAVPLPKQFLKIGDKTILETTVEKFNNSILVDEIIIVTANEYRNKCCQFCAEKNYFKVIEIVSGGKERQDSIYEGIKVIDEPKDDDIVLIHDGVRPYVTDRIIENVIKETDKSGAAIAAVLATDTVRQCISEDDLTTSKTLNRKLLYNVQTPQGFNYSLIKKAFQQAALDGYYGTDEGSLVERLGEKVSLVLSEYANIKITTQADLKAPGLLKQVQAEGNLEVEMGQEAEGNLEVEMEAKAMEIRVGTGYDVHRLVEGRPLILGGVLIPSRKGLLGHSDADVVTHALMDAILGAAALGDIGKHFPDKDEQYKGISSMILLEKVGDLVREKGYSLGNADMTIMCEAPKLAPYITVMRENMAEKLKVDVEKISVKATTTEKLGFVGREEGIGADAVCLLNKE